jgi:hypothetical protein
VFVHAGHVPMLADRTFAEMVEAIGKASLGADDKAIWHLTKVSKAVIFKRSVIFPKVTKMDKFLHLHFVIYSFRWACFAYIVLI